MASTPSPSYMLLILTLVSLQMDASSSASYTCELLETRTCLGEPLDFQYTTTELVSDSKNQREVQKNLRRWEDLRFLPKCWSVLQPFLCEVYVPKCENATVKLPCREQCLATRKPCSVVEWYYGRWPEFLRCENFPKATCNGTVGRVDCRVHYVVMFYVGHKFLDKPDTLVVLTVDPTLTHVFAKRDFRFLNSN